MSAQERHKSVAVDVGGVMVGGGAPIVVQSMTNTDTADVEGDRAPGGGARRAPAPNSCASPSTATRRRPPCRSIKERLGADGRRRAARSATSTTSATSCSPIIPACAEALDKYRINPGNVGFKNKRDPQFSADRRDGDQVRQAGAHRRQLGLARSGTAHAADGREREVGRAARRARGDARGDGAVGAAVGRARRGDRPAAQPHHPVGEGLGGAGPDRGLHANWRAAPTTRCISA